MGDRNVLGGELEPCGTDPLTGFYRDGCCTTGPEDLGSHTICAVVTSEFLEHQRRIGNDLSTPMPQFRFPGLVPGDRWCVTAANWLQAHREGAAAPVVLASTHQRALEIVPLEILKSYSVDVPAAAAPAHALTGWPWLWRGRLDSLSTRLHGSRLRPELGRPSIALSSSSPAVRPSSRRFMSTVVSGGPLAAAMTSQLSKPTSAMSSGTRLPASRTVSATPRAISSLPQKMASRSAAARSSPPAA